MSARKKPRFGQLVIGPPGAGKSTYCYGLQQFFHALGRPCSVVNLDPAVATTPYEASVDITELISLNEAMTEHQLGPNGAMLYCMEYLERNMDWLEDELDALPDANYIVIDMPGQVELSTDHDSVRRIVEQLTKRDLRLAAVHLTDAHHVSDASKYVSVVLLALRTMLQLELPHVNVLSKVDLIAQHGTLPFNLDFYTEVQDLSHLEELLGEQGPRTSRFKALNQAICEVIEDFGLVNFQTLCVEDKQSMAALIKVVDKAIGYIDEHHNHTEPDLNRVFETVERSTPLDRVQEVQERYIDHPDAYREHEREGWKREGEMMAKQHRQAEG